MISDIFNFQGNKSLLVEKNQSFLHGLFISSDDLRGVKTHLDQIISMTEELSSEGNNKVSGISTFFLLHFAGHGEHLGSRMLDLELNRESNTSFKMVAASEVT